MRYTLIVLIVGTALCRDALANTPIAPSCTYKVQAIVAHQDDDLFLMQNDLQRHLARGACAQVVYLTNGTFGEATWEQSARRDQGAMIAWSSMSGAAAPESVQWTQDRVEANGHRPVRYTHPDGRLTHIHLGVDSAWEDGRRGGHTLLSRMQSDVNYEVRAYPVRGADKAATESSLELYKRSGFQVTLGQLIKVYQPNILFTHDPFIKTAYDKLCELCGESNDHADRVASAKLALEALRISGQPAATQFYVGDPAAGRTANLTSGEADTKSRVAAWYGIHDSRYSCSRASSTAQPACAWPANPESKWLRAQYILIRNTDGPGAQAGQSGTADAQGGQVVAYVGGEDNQLHVWSGRSRADSSIEGRFAGVPAVAAGGDARQSIFVRTAQNDVLHVSSEGGTWRPTATWIDQIIVSSPQAMANSDGRVAVAARSADRSVLYRAEVSVGGAWSPWQLTGLVGVGEPAFAKDASGALAIAVRATAPLGTVLIRSQVQPGQAIFHDVAITAGSHMDPIMLTAGDGSVTVITKDVVGRNVSDFIVYRQSSPGALSANTTWTKTALGLRENWTNATATFAADKLIVAGNCGPEKWFEYHDKYTREYPNLCVWKDGVSTDLGPVKGAPQFVRNTGAEPVLMVRGATADAPLLGSKLQGGNWSALSEL
ncbi:PIG-L family deacetylase [Paraburkholderia sp.]|uniref:PIG-L family deacetylase n=1 Tax=Paraburkholderia sp. TaxID=1926495 RepID=UPI002D4FD2B4|nr:PIG-L family deacetylase [Paraburkholderia sp.]HZZ05778.1 PIG-L family deacetylase [Paraburkholderia sp.]